MVDEHLWYVINYLVNCNCREIINIWFTVLNEWEFCWDENNSGPLLFWSQRRGAVIWTPRLVKKHKCTCVYALQSLYLWNGVAVLLDSSVRVMAIDYTIWPLNVRYKPSHSHCLVVGDIFLTSAMLLHQTIHWHEELRFNILMNYYENKTQIIKRKYPCWTERFGVRGDVWLRSLHQQKCHNIRRKVFTIAMGTSEHAI